MVNRDEFIREVTIRICSSLEIKESLRNTFVYLREQLPLDELFLNIVDQNLGALRRIAYVGTEGSETPDEIIPLPEEIVERIKERCFREPFIASADMDDQIFQTMAPLIKLEGNSDMIVPLHLDSEPIGGLTLRAHGEGRYSEEQAEIMGYVTRPFAIALANALAHEAVLRYQDILLDDKRFLNRELYGHLGEEIIGGNTGLRNVMEAVRQVAPLNSTVLLLGETGTGKEIIANAIHFSSPRKDGPFIKVNCGAIPESLIDSELFGHERGAFTGAVAETRGRFERAEGGSIFLDEIGELPMTAQVRLLRVLQSREVERVGGKRAIPVNIRVIAATHRNLQNMIGEGSFREDLWFRLSTFPVMIPPVRQRKEDVPALTRHFVTVKSRELGIGMPPSIAPGALMRLMEYDWPGNVRELENLVERELIRHRGGALTFDTVLSGEERRSPVAAVEEGRPHLPLKLDEAMAAHITEVLKLTSGKIHGPGGAAELLGMNANTLRWRLDKLGIAYRRKSR
ncbi:sigma 54-interacting transcriptional regulator [Geomonas sp. Red32]|uniref:sigma 54-interacting transcriptional regulator n=1 Tax=Geomonas sp. Red32 TaxID=2912856 RepID=UPI00202CA93C|nr:sigma 54-interacting transcriptional regulator [Geomonas sp. Red32]MCM0082288.1 sigma 54-interacting transcriptional regulator [Geomonas sp. Red32]